MTVAQRWAGRRPLVGLLVAEAVSITGTRVSMIAIPLFVLASTGSATRTGLTTAVELLPMVLLKVLAGPVIDAAGPGRVAVGCDLVSVAAVAAVPLLHDADRLPFWLFLVLVAVAGGLRGPGDAAKHAMVPQVAAFAEVPIERVTGLYSAVERTASMLGAALAGVLVATLGPADALLLDAGSFAFSAGILLAATASLAGVAAATEGEAAPGDPLPYGARLRAGWDHLRTDRLLMTLAVMLALTNMLDIAWSAVLMPVWSVESGNGAAALGLLLGLWGGFSAAGSLAAAAWAERLPRFRVYVLAFLVTGLPRFAVLAFDVPLAAVLTVFAVGGFASGFLNPILGAVELERIPARLVGRVTAIISALAWSIMPVGSLVGGFLADSWGLGATLLTLGAAYLVVTVGPAFDRHVRTMGTPPSRAPRDAE